MSFYARIKNIEELKSLKDLNLRDPFKFYYALFFESRMRDDSNLIGRGLAILYCDRDVIHLGNYENVGPSWGWEELAYDEFVSRISTET